MPNTTSRRGRSAQSSAGDWVDAPITKAPRRYVLQRVTITPNGRFMLTRAVYNSLGEPSRVRVQIRADRTGLRIVPDEQGPCRVWIAPDGMPSISNGLSVLRALGLPRIHATNAEIVDGAAVVDLSEDAKRDGEAGASPDAPWATIQRRPRQ